MHFKTFIKLGYSNIFNNVWMSCVIILGLFRMLKDNSFHIIQPKIMYDEHVPFTSAWFSFLFVKSPWTVKSSRMFIDDRWLKPAK